MLLPDKICQWCPSHIEIMSLIYIQMSYFVFLWLDSSLYHIVINKATQKEVSLWMACENRKITFQNTVFVGSHYASHLVS